MHALLGVVSPVSDITPVVSEQSLAQMQVRAPEILEQARSISVLDEASYVEACNLKLAAKAILDTIDALTTNIRQKHADALDAALMPWVRIASRLEEAIEVAEQKRKAYKVSAEAAQQAAAAEESAARVERLKSELAANVQALRDANLHEVAAELEKTQIDPMPVQLGRAVPKVKGIVDRKTWKVKVDDKLMAARAIGARLLLDAELNLPEDLERLAGPYLHTPVEELLEALDVNLTYFRPKATRERTAFNYPGITAWQD